MTVKERRRLEFAIRAKLLARDGYEDYAAYVRGRHWKLTRSAYFAHPDTPKACFCGEDDEWKLALHHKTYVRLGAEDLRDLHPLCDACHSDVHVIAKRGLAPFDLEDYADDRRRRQYIHERQAMHRRRGEQPDKHSDDPFDEFNWRMGAQDRHAHAVYELEPPTQKRERIRKLCRGIRAM